jgi:hypothetical protein
LLIVGVLGSGFAVFTPAGLAQQPLPTYADFRRIDRERRLNGQLQTEELLKVTQIDRRLLQQTALRATNDFQVIWGGAELITSWPIKRQFFEAALEASGTNMMVALRYACAAAQQKDEDIAFPLLHLVEKSDDGNVVPWLVDLRLLEWDSKEFADLKWPASRAIHYRDYAVDAARARIRMLEAAGYSPYSARRLGFAPDTPVLVIARDLIEPPIDKATAPFLLSVARAMQDKPMYLLTELVGETLERAVTATGVGGKTGAEANARAIALDRRREEIKALVASVERDTADVATEAEMVRYFDDVLNLGEDVAMRRLVGKVQGQPLP